MQAKSTLSSSSQQSPEGDGVIGAIPLDNMPLCGVCTGGIERRQTDPSTVSVNITTNTRTCSLTKTKAPSGLGDWEDKAGMKVRHFS